jgi:predicted metalloprotease with PDZ domain
MRGLFARVAPPFAASLCCIAAATTTSARAQAAAPIALAVDVSQAPQKIFGVRETIPVTPGPFTFVYPEWIPGYHGPVGPLPGVVGLHVTANGAPLGWRRDLVDFYAIHTTVPSGATTLDVAFDVVDAQPAIGEEPPRDTANLAILQWSSYLVYPQGAKADALAVALSVTVPSGWDFATALPVRARTGSSATFEPVSLTTLVDSPLLTGRYFRRIALSSEPFAELDMAADSAAALRIRPAIAAGMKHLVAEAPALYGSRHWRTYHFLLALTDVIPANGIEHHESSDNRAPEAYVTDFDTFRVNGDLMAHEFSHSWNGKYRRPYDLWTPDFQQPEKTDLLWVYEGLNQYVGELLATRSRLYDVAEEREVLAMGAAQMDAEGGRRWRPLRDVADEAPILYVTPPQFGALRRAANDFYTEGDLIWLEVDTIIRARSAGKRSIDDFLHAWASGGSTTPSVKTYTYDDVIATLQSVEPYDWRAFFDERIAQIQPTAPLAGIENAGWRLVYDDTPSERWKATEDDNRQVDVSLSAGFIVSTDDAQAGGSGAIVDVEPDSPASRAGIAPGMRLLAVNGRKWSADVLHDALTEAKASRRPIELLIANGDFYSTVSVAAYTGNRYPHLERANSKPDLLSRIYAPRTFTPKHTSEDE